MAVKKIFISFDYDHDDELRGSFLDQANRYCKHSIADFTFPGTIDEAWKLDARSRIGNSDVVIFICGVNTHSANGVNVEMTITQQLRRPYILLKGRQKWKCTMPKGANKKDEMHPWKWTRINKLLDS